MEEPSPIDRRTTFKNEDEDVIVRQTSKLLEELFRAHSRHPEFIHSVLWCMRTLIGKGSFSEESNNVIKFGVNGLVKVFSTGSIWVQSQIVVELYRYNLPEVIVLLANAFHSPINGVTVPVRLLLHGRSHIGTEVEMFLPSYAMAVGENSAFNLGLAADGPVLEARKVPLEGVKKVSMSSAHTLFLTHKGEVFACGAAANFGFTKQNGKLIVSPVKVGFPGEALPVVDVAAGPNHSVFITTKMVYVCGINNNFCLGLKKDKGQYSMKNVKLPVPEGVKKLRLEKVFTNIDCTIVRSASDMWIVGKTPLNVHETFTLVTKDVGVYEMIRSSGKLLGLSYKLAIVYFSTVPWVFPVSVIHVDYKSRDLKNIEVTITNNSGVLSYTFDPRPSRILIKPCVTCVNGVIVELQCVDYHVTSKGDVMLMGYPGGSRTTEYCSLFHGQVRVIEDKATDDGFTEAYLSGSNVTGLRVLLVLQEVPGAHAVSSFARSPDGRNLIYVTNSSTVCRNVQWETADYAKLNEERELSCLEKVHLDFHIFDMLDTCTDTLENVVRARFPKVSCYSRENNEVWIEELTKDISNVKCGQIFRDYLVYNENRVMNRGSTTKAMIDKICNVLGVQCIRCDRYYQLGDPLDSLDKFVAFRNCVLVSEEGVEIEFVRELLELQSSYFGIAVSYQENDEVPVFRLCACEEVIRRGLLSIINPNYIRTLKTSEIVELLPFLDQYLLHAVTADAIRVLFERVNEFCVGVLFDLYETFPQLRSLISEYFYNDLHLLAYWKSSAAASTALVRDVFSCAAAEGTAEQGSGYLFEPFTLEAPKIYILDSYRKASWSLFRTEDVMEILLGPGNRDAALEQAVLKHLQEYITEEESDETSGTSKQQFHPPDSPEPELIATIRDRLGERERVKVRKIRKKSTRKSSSEGVVFKLPTQEIFDIGEICMQKSDSAQEFAKSELNEHLEYTTEKNQSSDRMSCSVLPESIIEEDECDQQTTLKSPWKAIETSLSLSVASSFVELQDLHSSSNKKKTGRFAPKGTKFRDANNLLHDNHQGTHFAPWSTVLHEEKTTKQAETLSQALKQVHKGQERRITSGSVSWSEGTLLSSFDSSPLIPSLAEIMKEEERRQSEGNKRISRPLQFIEDEERAIDELTQLYRENIGDEVVVRVERCDNSADICAYRPVWTNTLHFRT